MANDGLAKQLGAVFKDKDKPRLTTTVARHLVKAEPEFRRTDCLHPSAISKENWCKRQAYYAITGHTPAPKVTTLAMEVVFETGHDAHRKWQGWWWDMGILHGLFGCKWCGLQWLDNSPASCPRCEVGKDLLTYLEVPVRSDQYMIAGNADGDIDWQGERVLTEIKTIGTGTVRWEAPQLIAKHSYTHVDDHGKEHTGTDWAALWSDIRRPFPSHLRQGMVYLFCMGYEHIMYIYDPKLITAHPKEFLVKFNPEIIEDILDDCSIVKKAVELSRKPKRPIWAEPQHKECKSCGFREECYGTKHH